MPLTVHEGDDATFRCEVSPPDADITWLRNGVVVTPGPQLEMTQNGSSRMLTVRSCRLEDAGTVTARAGGTSTSARLHVRGPCAFSKSSLNIRKFTVHILLKPGLENFEHYFTSTHATSMET